MEDGILHLRPHHLLCVQMFTGHGYDAAFTAHLRETVARLHREPETPVQLCAGADDLCAFCPHLQGGICRSEAKTSSLDAAVLRILTLQSGVRGTWHSLADAAFNQILQAPAFHTVCSGCEWYALCRETERIQWNR